MGLASWLCDIEKVSSANVSDKKAFRVLLYARREKIQKTQSLSPASLFTSLELSSSLITPHRCSLRLVICEKARFGSRIAWQKIGVRESFRALSPPPRCSSSKKQKDHNVSRSRVCRQFASCPRRISRSIFHLFNARTGCFPKNAHRNTAKFSYYSQPADTSACTESTKTHAPEMCGGNFLQEREWKIICEETNRDRSHNIIWISAEWKGDAACAKIIPTQALRLIILLCSDGK